MTSTVKTKTAARLSEIFGATFPSASITGAPKYRATEIIAELEHQPRGIYTGALGHILPGGDAQFAVAIRTLVTNRETGVTSYGVGSGIVADSDPHTELAETQLKAQVLGGNG